MNKSCIIAQSGGPTAVINSSLLGVIEEAKKQGFEHIYGALNGVEGILNERIIAEDSYIMDGALYVDDLDVTDYTLKNLLTWLGY